MLLTHRRVYDIMKSFSQRLLELMELNNLSKRALALQTGLDRKSILNWLNGTFLPRVEALCRLADYFKVSVEYLLGLNGDYSNEEWVTITNSELPNVFRTRLKELLKHKNYTEYRLSKTLGIEQSTISKWMHGSMPETLALVEIARTFECTIDFLVGRTDVV